MFPMQMCFRILKDTGLISAFGLLEKELILYLHVLESGYRDIPFHNRVHAADVLHGVYYLCTQPVAGLKQSPRSKNVGTANLQVVTSFREKQFGERQKKGNQKSTLPIDPNSERTYGILAANITRLELLAVLLAAAMHDYDHPGRSNRFLVLTKSPLAQLYNNRSVLEQHHVSKSWELMESYPECNFLKNMHPTERSKLQQLTVDCVLATDLDRHSIVLETFNDQVKAGLNWADETHRLSVLLMVIKLADVSGPCKRFDLHSSWMNLLCQEFYQQGEEERNRGWEITKYMDGNHPETAKLQSSFITNVVQPLLTAYSNAGLMPSQWVLPVPPALDGMEDAPNQGDGERQSLMKDCIPMKHLQDNLSYWTNILEHKGQKGGSAL
ncbi:cGMP-inhibited 3',5'-cyclic phosphodiesterase B-like isoform X2 [Varroa jacobsoni]|uniref:cGMP-inhibited 3',5'-cyclic phosphodiesterase B-like isoform X2 n=1 Tax=Varroa jacobsoni TaxID=62625 RepID=UPI000BF9CE98|nr:cGMP-inhibited 3',5'-cyclic phosphodiesterase B-like isoform X2 [Varroa jacobsoni]